MKPLISSCVISLVVCFQSATMGQSFICTMDASQTASIRFPECFLPDTMTLYQPGDTLGPLYLRFHVLRMSSGSRDPYKPLNNDSLQKIFNDTRSAFLASHLKIDLRLLPNIHYIDNDIIFYDFRDGRMNPYQLAGLYDSSGVVDVYFTLSIARNTPQQPAQTKQSATMASVLGEPFGSIFIGTSHYWDENLATHGRILTHELGHVLGLLHTFDQTFGVERIVYVGYHKPLRGSKTGVSRFPRASA